MAETPDPATPPSSTAPTAPTPSGTGTPPDSEEGMTAGTVGDATGDATGDQAGEDAGTAPAEGDEAQGDEQLGAEDDDGTTTDPDRTKNTIGNIR